MQKVENCSLIVNGEKEKKQILESFAHGRKNKLVNQN